MNDLARTDEIKSALSLVQNQILSLTHDKDRAKQFMACCLQIATDTNLQKCTVQSLVRCCVDVAVVNLSIDKYKGHCYIVPYYNSKSQETHAQMTIGYKGMIHLAGRAGWEIRHSSVFECDDFHMSSNGWDNDIQLIPNHEARKLDSEEWCFQNLKGILVMSRNDDQEITVFVTKSEIEKRRHFSKTQQSGKYTSEKDKKRLSQGLPIGIWEKWYIEMAVAKAIRKLMSTMYISDNKIETVLQANELQDNQGLNIDYQKTTELGIITEREQESDNALINMIDKCNDIQTLKSLLPKIQSISDRKTMSRTMDTYVQKKDSLNEKA